MDLRSFFNAMVSSASARLSIKENSGSSSTLWKNSAFKVENSMGDGGLVLEGEFDLNSDVKEILSLMDLLYPMEDLLLLALVVFGFRKLVSTCKCLLV
ncbi:hypothetical protein WICMUC_005809 [Wickerhamomyces mucosus]|uniref:Uncharacterized protein n=1 Tax=Wickerhamomyces mucosus TaxID=1378264 RepID=A0A9P8P493_9ASCO|nr:hypothetical protein WICMUC_005809 [Wickerhamomyces mucosus]